MHAAIMTSLRCHRCLVEVVNEQWLVVWFCIVSPVSVCFMRRNPNMFFESVFFSRLQHRLQISQERTHICPKTPAHQNHRTSLEDIDSAEAHNG